MCSNGICTCPTGRPGDDRNCAVCGHDCTRLNAVCSNRQTCTCVSGKLGDYANCGKRGNKCEGRTYCSSGKCICRDNSDCINRKICDPITDTCQCPDGQVIDPKGKCVCPSGTLPDPITGVCRSPRVPPHPTEPASICSSGQVICNGQCVNLSNDRNNCGTCGNTCPNYQSCVNSTCQPTQCSGGLYPTSDGRCVQRCRDEVNPCPSGWQCGPNGYFPNREVCCAPSAQFGDRFQCL
jgi:hypothetical protein